MAGDYYPERKPFFSMNNAFLTETLTTNGEFGVTKSDEQTQVDAIQGSLAQFQELNVGPNDILVVRVKTTGVAPAHIGSFLRKVKQSLQSVWEGVGLGERVLYEAGEVQSFSVIHVQKPPLQKAMLQKRKWHSTEPPLIG